LFDVHVVYSCYLYHLVWRAPVSRNNCSAKYPRSPQRCVTRYMYVLEVAFFLDLGVTYSIMIVLPITIPTSVYLYKTSYRVQCCLREMDGAVPCPGQVGKNISTAGN